MNLFSELLNNDFGIESRNCIQFVEVLIDIFNKKSAAQTMSFFNKWKKSFSESCGYDFAKLKPSAVSLVNKFTRNETDLDQLLFCLQTYFSLILAVFASEVVCLKTNADYKSYIKFLLEVDKEKFAEIFKTMVSNKIFESVGIKEFLGDTLFWWFTDEWSLSLEEAIYSILRTLNNYETLFGEIHAGGSKDIFKDLYENLVPSSVRHDLGEYYTPNWIVEYIINDNIDLYKETRILDPACGSGTFLIHAIDLFKRQFESTMNKSTLLHLITNQIVGFDLNPIAIVTARTNYLIAIVDLIPFAKKGFEIPIFLMDTILANESIPPYPHGKFDYVVGNPPWISWENLPPSYRITTQNLWKQYNLFSIKKGSEARLGGGKKDFSMLFVFKCIDKYLKDGGHLVFLITQTIFQSVKTGEGFRKFQIKGNEYFRVLKVDDLSDLKPFTANAQAAIIYCKKGENTIYPIKYKIWKKNAKIDYSDNSLSFRDIKDCISEKQFLAQPSSKRLESPWIIYPSSDKDFPRLIRALKGGSPYLGKSGVCTWLNGVFWIKILELNPDGTILIENISDVGKIKVPSIQMKIEPDLVYPLIRGRDIRQWNITSTENYYILITNNPDIRKGITVSKMKTEYPNTYKYFLNFKDTLIRRSGYKKYFKSTDPFYSIYNVNQNLFAPFKLLWSEIGDFRCAIGHPIVDQFLGEKIPVPNNKVMYIPFFSENEACFVAGVLNSPLVRKFIAAKKLVTSTSTNLIREMRVPKFNVELFEHQQIVEISKDLRNDKKSRSQEQLQQLIQEIYS